MKASADGKEQLPKERRDRDAANKVEISKQC